MIVGFTGGRFRAKPLDEIEADLMLVGCDSRIVSLLLGEPKKNIWDGVCVTLQVGRLGVRVRRVFLADGDAMTLPVNRLR